jgi:hypothetical protein
LEADNFKKFNIETSFDVVERTHDCYYSGVKMLRSY